VGSPGTPLPPARRSDGLVMLATLHPSPAGWLLPAMKDRREWLALSMGGDASPGGPRLPDPAAGGDQPGPAHRPAAGPGRAGGGQRDHFLDFDADRAGADELSDAGQRGAVGFDEEGRGADPGRLGRGRQFR